jgi:anaerobic magnesium-protoporphyrin IX monomethyl ester cyclase
MMRVLLVAMPDTVCALDPVMRVPNLGLCSIAGNLEGCEVRVIDLVFHNRHIGKLLRRLMEEFNPEIVGLSAMSFQFASACHVSRICRSINPDVKVALGGYHASLMYQEIASGSEAELFDFLIRGEGEVTFAGLVEELISGRRDFSRIPGLSFRNDGTFHHNPPASPVDLETLKPPNRDCRVLDRARFLGHRFDCVETSRGCTMRCRFCSITRMYGRSIRKFALERVIAELHQLKRKGVEGVFFVDDNITLDVPRLKQLCKIIISEKLNTMSYAIQASVPGIASDPELAEMLGRAGFRWVFLGIESGISRNLESMGKAGVLKNTMRAVSLLQKRGICVFGGFILGHPDDTRQDIQSTFQFALDSGVDHPIMQCLTPYPKTETRQQLLNGGLITNLDDFSRYNGFICNVSTKNLSNKDLNRAVFWGGMRLYFSPQYLKKSRFWRYKPSLWPSLMVNNFRYQVGAIRGNIFASRHTW